MFAAAAKLKRLRISKIRRDSSEICSLKNTEVRRWICRCRQNRVRNRRKLRCCQRRQPCESRAVQIDTCYGKLAIDGVWRKAGPADDCDILRVCRIKSSLIKSGCVERRRAERYRKVAGWIAEIIERSSKYNSGCASKIFTRISANYRFAVIFRIPSETDTRSKFVWAVRDRCRINRFAKYRKDCAPD